MRGCKANAHGQFLGAGKDRQLRVGAGASEVFQGFSTMISFNTWSWAFSATMIKIIIYGNMHGHQCGLKQKTDVRY